MELRLIGHGVCVSAIGGRHPRNETGKSANRRGGKEDRQRMFHVIASDCFDRNRDLRQKTLGLRPDPNEPAPDGSKLNATG